MSDPLSIFRNAVRDASPGPLIEDEATIFAADGSGYQVLRPDEYWGANDDEIPPDVQARLDANAQHIINADRLARFIASEEAPTVEPTRWRRKGTRETQARKSPAPS